MISYFNFRIAKVLLKELKVKGLSLRFIKRSANSVAHFLASYSYLTGRAWRVNNNHSELINVLKNNLKS